jgi:hypothetical protein
MPRVDLDHDVGASGKWDHPLTEPGERLVDRGGVIHLHGPGN